MKKKGFTLVELLAVIVILAVIGLISVPMILNNIEKSRISTYRSNTQMLIEASKQYVSKKMEDNDYPQSGINIKDLSFKKGNFKSGIIKRCNEEDVKAGNCTSEEVGEIIAVNIYNGKYCAKGTKQAIEVLKVETEKDCENIDSTSPELTLKVIKATNNSVLIAAYGYDSQSKITKYTFKIGDGEEKVKETESRVATYEFTNLKANQEYEITVSVENENKDNYNETTYKTTKSITVSTLETNIPTFKVSGSGYSSSKEVTITYPKIEGGENYYDITYDGETWTTTKVEGNKVKVVFTKNGKIRAYTKYPGNVVENTLNVIGIDEGGPTFELEVVNENKWEREKVVRVYHKDSDGKKINGALDTGIGLDNKAYSFDGGKTWINKYTSTYIKNEKVDVIVRDKIGNKTTKSISITRVDRTAPTCISSYTSGSSAWTKNNVSIIGNCNDNGGSGCQKANVSVTTSQEQSKKVSPGKVCDKLNNCSTCPSLQVNIDKTAPSCNGQYGGKTNWTGNQNVTVGAYCKDNGKVNSGCQRNNFSTTISGNGKTQAASVTISDKAGNTRSCTYTYNKYIDTVGPNKPSIGLYVSSTTGNTSVGGGYGSGSWTNRNVMTRASSSDSGSGISYYQYSHDGKGWSNDISKLGWIMSYGGNKNNIDYWITWEGQWNFFVRAVDNVGNPGPASNAFVIRIDKTAPSCSIIDGSALRTCQTTAGQWYGRATGELVRLYCTDSASGINYNSVFALGGVGENQLIATPSDAAGNVVNVYENICGYSSDGKCGTSGGYCAQYACTLYKSCTKVYCVASRASNCAGSYDVFVNAQPSGCTYLTGNTSGTKGYAKFRCTGRNPVCGTETAYGSACNNAQSRYCSQWVPATANSCWHT